MESLEYLKSRRERIVEELGRPSDPATLRRCSITQLEWEGVQTWLKNQLLAVDARIAELTAEPVQG